MAQDTMVLPNKIIIPINVFLTSKADLLTLFEKPKNESSISKRYSSKPIEIFLIHYDRPTDPLHFMSKSFQLRWTQPLYNIFRYNKLSDLQN